MVTAQLCGAAWSLEVFSSWAVGQSQQPREPHPLRGSRRWRFRGENIFSPLPFVRTSSLKALLCFVLLVFVGLVVGGCSSLTFPPIPAASLRYPPHDPLHQQEHPSRENSIRDKLWVPALLPPFFRERFALGVVVSQKSSFHVVGSKPWRSSVWISRSNYSKL